ncbi:MAG: hypothetical protein IAI48_11770, partial [Candidatus Eremiobacteraeota bacterium]|nr:hypothetical protein [Candidatus Eremiobacteraeota bacterium]
MRSVRLASFVRAASFVLAAIVFAPGCTKVDTSAGSGREVSAGGNPWTHHGQFVYAEPLDTKSLNPMLATSSVAGDLSMFLFSYAVVYDDKARAVPEALRELPTFANGDV